MLFALVSLLPAPHAESQLPLLEAINPSPGTKPRLSACQGDSAAEMAAIATLPHPGSALHQEEPQLSFGGAPMTNPAYSRSSRVLALEPSGE